MMVGAPDNILNNEDKAGHPLCPCPRGWQNTELDGTQLPVPLLLVCNEPPQILWLKIAILLCSQIMWVRNSGRAWLGSSFTLGRVDGGFSVILSWLKGWSRRPKTALLACLGDGGGLKIRTAKQSTYAWLLHVLGVLTHGGLRVVGRFPSRNVPGNKRESA